MEPGRQIAVMMIGNHWTGRTVTMAQIAEYQLYPVDKAGPSTAPQRSSHAVMMKLQSIWPGTWSTATTSNFGSLTGL
jgi:hypothetical protein